MKKWKKAQEAVKEAEAKFRELLTKLIGTKKTKEALASQEFKRLKEAAKCFGKIDSEFEEWASE